MANIRKIRNRASTAKKIRALTRTMEMIATARFQRSHSLSAQGRPYTDRLTDLVSQVIAALGKKDSHPLLDQREQGQQVNAVRHGHAQAHAPARSQQRERPAFPTEMGKRCRRPGQHEQQA